jgi:hypothetical protein
MGGTGLEPVTPSLSTRRILQSATGSELLAEPEDPLELGADVKGERLAAGHVNLDGFPTRLLDLVVGRADDEDVSSLKSLAGRV